MRKLYKIWCVRLPDGSGYDRRPYSLESVLSVTHHDRSNVVSGNYDKLVTYCAYLNDMRDEDEYFEVREEECMIY